MAADGIFLLGDKDCDPVATYLDSRSWYNNLHISLTFDIRDFPRVSARAGKSPYCKPFGKMQVDLPPADRWPTCRPLATLKVSKINPNTAYQRRVEFGQLMQEA